MASRLSGQEADVTMGIRPEFVRLGCGPENSFPAKVGLIEPLGSRTLVFLEIETGEIRCAIQGEADCKEKENLQAGFDLEKALFFDDKGIRI